MTDLALIVCGFLAVNAITFAAFVHDKRAAQRGDRRVAERTLLLLALVGGTPGAYAARHVVRHKTRKQPFVSLLHLTACLQLVVLALVLWLPGAVTYLLSGR